MKRILIIAGATASGKSARAMARAREHRGTIINADAMQVYRELRILTARPSAADEAAVPHALYGHLPAAEACSAGRWLADAAEAIRTAWGEGRLPIVTGGTGLYIKALMEGLSPIPDVPEEVRQKVRGIWELGCQGDGFSGDQGMVSPVPPTPRSPDHLHTLLAARDPEMAARLRPSDPQRILRALEVLEATGKSLAYWQDQPRQPIFPEAEFTLEVVELPRAELYARIDARFLAMLAEGAVEEVRALAALGLPRSLPAMRAVGVPELMEYIEGKQTLEDATARAQQMSRNYAKRQLTWIRNQFC